MIYLCIPAHNEEQTVGVVLWKIRQVLTDFPRDYQLLVADDASTDGTAEVLAPYARVLPLTVLRAREQRGYAASLEMLLREAVRRSPYPRRDVIVTLQADFTDEPEDIVPLIKKIEQGADIVGGTRATDTRPELLERWLLRWQRRLLRRARWPDDAGDPLSGFRTYRVYTIARAIEDAGSDRLLKWDGAIADAELLRAAAAHARRAESIDLAHRPDRRQRESRASTWETLKRLRRFMRGARPLDTVPLAELSPETVPPPRPLEIERERRSEAAATPERGRNGRRTGGRRPERATERTGGGRQTRTTGQRSEGSRPERKRPERPAAQGAAAGSRDRPQRARRKPAEAVDAADSVAPAALGATAEGTQSTDPTADAPVKKKRRRRRRRKSAGTTGEVQTQATNGQPDAGTPVDTDSDAAPAAASAPEGATAEGAEGAPRKRRRRGGRRGGRGRRRKSAGAQGEAGSAGESESVGSGAVEPASVGGERNEDD